MRRKWKRKHPVRKLFMSLVALLLCTLFAVCAFFGVKGYQMYKRAVEEQPINERVEEICNMEGFTPYSALPQFYIAATISVEDRRFEEHCGIDLIAIGRAAWTDMTDEGPASAFRMTEECAIALEEGKEVLKELTDKLRGIAPGWIRNQLEKAGEVLTIFTGSSKRYILHLEQDKGKLPQLCATSRKIPDILSGMLWSQGFPAILTSGTLKAGNGFSRTRQENGLGKEIRVMEYVAESPFAYEKNCLLYLPQTLRRTKHGSREEAVMMAQHIQRLICSTYGHTLVLFTSYSLMGSVYQILRDSLPFPMVEVWRNAQEEIMRFKTMENAVLFAAGSCWEGVDFPGDIVSSLIIVKLPFAVPDPLREAEKERYATLTEYIRDIIVPDMQKKLRQGFGRAIRTESDTCVVSILDHRAVAGGRYHEDVLCALPACQMAETIEDVETFIRRQKCEEYYM